MSQPTVREIARALEAWAPPGTAQSYDNVGLQVGRAESTVSRALVALDLTPAVLHEAKSLGAQLIITHHPLLFRPLKSVTSGAFVSGLALELAESSIALYAIHTNLDAAHGGVSFALAEQLGLQDAEFLAPLGDDGLKKIIVYVPNDSSASVREAMHAAGGGQVGHYRDVSFTGEGVGSFTPGPEASPLLGSVDAASSVREDRIEMHVPNWAAKAVVQAAQNAHPYEHAVCDVVSLEQPDTRTGLGAIGSLPEPESLHQFLGRVSRVLQTPAVRYVGDPDRPVRRVAVCGGSGSDFTSMAMRAGADAYVTGDVTYHRYFEVLDESGLATMALIDAGHYESEAVTEALIVSTLSSRFADVEWMRTSHRTSPMELYVAGQGEWP